MTHVNSVARRGAEQRISRTMAVEIGEAMQPGTFAMRK
jgi:hypothetical protein